MPPSPSQYRCAACGNEIPVAQTITQTRGSHGSIQLRFQPWCENGHNPRPMDLTLTAEDQG